MWKMKIKFIIEVKFYICIYICMWYINSTQPHQTCKRENRNTRGGYLLRQGLVCASSSCREWRSRVTTNPGRAACAAVARVAPAHSTWPVPRGPMRATKQNKVKQSRASAGTKRSHATRPAGLPARPILHQRQRERESFPPIIIIIIIINNTV